MKIAIGILWGFMLLTCVNAGAVDGYEQGIAAYHAKNYPTAFRIFKRLANQGNTLAQLNLSRMYSKGEIKKDSAQELFWLTKAAQGGSAEAQYDLGQEYDSGALVKNNDTQALYWYTKAANQNNAEAQFALGLVYGLGLGVKENKHQSNYWMLRAANQGHVDAQFQLGQSCDVARRFEGSNKQACDWLEKAAKQNHWTAYEILNP